MYKGKIIYAVYRLLYGEDFVKDSILSIIDSVDKVICFCTDKPWGRRQSATWKNKEYKFPDVFDKTRQYVVDLNNIYQDKIIIVDQSCPIAILQMAYDYNVYIKNMETQPDFIVSIEADMIINDPCDLKKMIDWSLNNKVAISSMNSVNHFRHPSYTFNYKLPAKLLRVSPGRHSVILWNLNLIDLKVLDISTYRGDRGEHVPQYPIVRSPFWCHNFGYCWNEKTMFFKFIVNISQARLDNEPNEDWFENKYLLWSTYVKDMEISKGFEQNIPDTFKESKLFLPKCIQNRLCDWNYLPIKKNSEKYLEFWKWTEQFVI